MYKLKSYLKTFNAAIIVAVIVVVGTSRWTQRDTTIVRYIQSRFSILSILLSYFIPTLSFALSPSLFLSLTLIHSLSLFISLSPSFLPPSSQSPTFFRISLSISYVWSSLFVDTDLNKFESVFSSLQSICKRHDHAILPVRFVRPASGCRLCNTCLLWHSGKCKV